MKLQQHMEEFCRGLEKESICRDITEDLPYLGFSSFRVLKIKKDYLIPIINFEKNFHNSNDFLTIKFNRNGNFEEVSMGTSFRKLLGKSLESRVRERMDELATVTDAYLVLDYSSSPRTFKDHHSKIKKELEKISEGGAVFVHYAKNINSTKGSDSEAFGEPLAKFVADLFLTKFGYLYFREAQLPYGKVPDFLAFEQGNLGGSPEDLLAKLIKSKNVLFIECKKSNYSLTFGGASSSAKEQLLEHQRQLSSIFGFDEQLDLPKVVGVPFVGEDYAPFPSKLLEDAKAQGFGYITLDKSGFNYYIPKMDGSDLEAFLERFCEQVL